jgi:hypothetical protein
VGDHVVEGPQRNRDFHDIGVLQPYIGEPQHADFKVSV